MTAPGRFSGVWFVLLSAALGRAEPPESFDAAFRRHLHAGTLLEDATSRQFIKDGQGPAYRDSVARHYAGQQADGLELSASIPKEHAASVGKPLHLEFELANASDEARRVVSGSTCGIVHPLMFLLIDPQGRLWQNCGRIRVGGFHRCESTTKELAAGNKIRLQTSTVSETVVPFVPERAGPHVVIGIYELSAAGKAPRRAFSRPVTAEVVAP